MKIAVLDAKTLGDDLDLSPLFAVGEVTVYEKTSPHEVAERLDGVDVAVINKIRLNETNLAENETLSLICLAATGYDNIDVAYCRARGIAVANVVGYSTDSVAQITLAMALSLASHLPAYSDHVRSGAYSAGGVANCLVPPYHELCGKVWGVVGLGNIGRRVARVASALGCSVIALKRSPDAEFPVVDLDTLCSTADIISVHLPLTDATRAIIGEREIAKMKPTTIFINVARGAVTDEAALARAVETGCIGGIGIDVYSAEPLPKEHPFFAIRERENVCFTPHMAWGALEARERCLFEITENIRAFARGERRCRVD